ncbi:MAG TPA: HNH endonuclease signature motif containing protein [Methylibium sp.]|uniref:HNH endonuclease n=1 Tax=Methylibium sp. TaxID=2067992 RepID=UPI002DB76C01|nr:HNH endonuclease signature motif containing protein [Methylibium sp.]HEU4460148.1 HNH endonuclease signature motif containing protein [Methylibium sp.]
MQGHIKRLRAQAAHAARQSPPTPSHPICPLCSRPIPASQRDAHHLIPKSHGGTQTAWLHRICHRQIHALFTEAELARSFHHVEALRAHPDIARFVAWVRTKPDDFHERTRRSTRLRGR